MNYLRLREKYPIFKYLGFGYDIRKNNLIVNFNYQISELNFIHEDIFNFDNIKHYGKAIKSKGFQNLIFHLGLAEMFSYWKTTCSPVLEISAGYLVNEQLNWWRDLLIKGMGQYFFENKIDINKDDFVRIISAEKPPLNEKLLVKSNKNLIPVGGGKDSIVTLETLLKEGLGDAALVVYPTTPYSKEVVDKSGIKKVYYVQRNLDLKLIKPNSKIFLNGHIPYSNILYFTSLIVANLNGYKNVVFSNERSSEEGNVNYLGHKINHQYTKTQEFERKFFVYNKKYLSNVNVFSILRPLYEIQIAKMFSKYDKYFGIFRSCNLGQKEGVWCCNCPKCLSTFILLFPFLGTRKILKIFPRNLYEDISLTKLLDKLISEESIKPFECVGTKDEVKAGLYLSMKSYGKIRLPVLLKYFGKSYLDNIREMDMLSEKLLTSWGESEYMPKYFSKKLIKYYENS